MSCLETVESAGGVAGVAIELDTERLRGADGSERLVLELQLDQAATIRVPLQPYARGGRSVWRATLPLQAFLRIAHARHISAHLPGASRTLGASDREALRRIARLLDAAAVHPERARR